MTGYRTLAVQLLTIIAAAVQANTDVLDPKYTPLVLTVVACLNIVLRFLTTGPVGGEPRLVIKGPAQHWPRVDMGDPEEPD